MSAIQKQYFATNLQGYPFYHYGLMHDGQAICHADLILVGLSHCKQNFKAAILSNVLTLPAFRKQGLGSLLIAAISREIQCSKCDFGLLFCDSRLKYFYTAHNWESFELGLNRIGTSEQFKSFLSLRMMLFVSKKAKAYKSGFSNSPLYLPHAF